MGHLWAEGIASSSELRVRDEAGNVTTLSPHNFSLISGGASEAMAWSFYSENNGVAVNVDMLKALRVLESLAGEQLVYEKNLATGEYVEEPSQSKQVLGDRLKSYVSQKGLAKYMNFGEQLLSFIADVVFKAKAVFENSVEFLALVTFKGKITVNADTAGVIIIPPYTRKYNVKFNKAFDKKLLIYLSLSDSGILYKVFGITNGDFSVEIQNPQNIQLEFSWLALLSDDQDFSKLEVVESSEDQSKVGRETITAMSEAQMFPDASPSSALLEN
jgi:hypothetical protein